MKNKLSIKANVVVWLKMKSTDDTFWEYSKERVFPFMPFNGLEYEVLDGYLHFGKVINVCFFENNKIEVRVEVINSITGDEKQMQIIHNRFLKKGWTDSNDIED